MRRQAFVLDATGAMLPDPLQFVHTRMPHEPLWTLQRFHLWAHKSKVSFLEYAGSVRRLYRRTNRGQAFFDSAFAVLHAGK
jgi:hypothetical protein